MEGGEKLQLLLNPGVGDTYEQFEKDDGTDIWFDIPGWNKGSIMNIATDIISNAWASTTLLASMLIASILLI
jgi:hypothetical protein